MTPKKKTRRIRFLLDFITYSAPVIVPVAYMFSLAFTTTPTSDHETLAQIDARYNLQVLIIMLAAVVTGVLMFGAEYARIALDKRAATESPA
jgi:hypothetical protein